MWQTETTDYSIRNTPWRGGHGDVLADVSASCRKHGLKLGVYVCPRDDHFGAKTGGICKTPELQARYNAMYRRQLTEVFSRYGELVEVWFDGSTATPVSDLLAKYQPHAMVFQGPAATIRWVGNEDGFAPNPCWNGIDRADAKTGTATSLNSDPDGDVWMPNEVDVSIRRPNWFWSTKNANKVLTPAQLLSVYYRSVGRGAQLLLNIPANRDGLLPDPDCASASAFGSEVRKRFAKPLAETAGQGAELTLTLPQSHPDRYRHPAGGDCQRRTHTEVPHRGAFRWNVAPAWRGHFRWPQAHSARRADHCGRVAPRDLAERRHSNSPHPGCLQYDAAPAQRLE